MAVTTVGAQISSVKKYLQTPRDVLDSFKKLASAGYRIIQIQWINPLVPAGFIADAMAETGLSCVSTQDYYDVYAPDIQNVIANNLLWGSGDITVSGIPDKYMSPEGCIAFAKELAELSKITHGHGLSLSFHPRVYEYAPVGGIPATQILLDNTGEDVRLGLDLYHVIYAGLDPIKWIADNAGRIDYVHFKDYFLDSDGKKHLCPIGQGVADWLPIFDACVKHGVRWGFAEQESWDKDAFLCMEESFRYITSNGISK